MPVAELRHGPLGSPAALALGIQDTANRLNQLIRAFNQLENTEITVGWDDITGKPSVFPADLSDFELDWADITGKPSSFPPSAHTHSWNQITARPEEFAPASHGSSHHSTGSDPLILAELVGSLPATRLTDLVAADIVTATDLLAGTYTIPSFAVDPGFSNRALIADMGGAIAGITNGGAGTVFLGGTPSGGLTNMGFGQIADAHVAPSAAIAYSKLALTGQIQDGDLTTVDAAKLTGTVNTARLVGAYTSITRVGTQNVLQWTDVARALGTEYRGGATGNYGDLVYHADNSRTAADRRFRLVNNQWAAGSFSVHSSTTATVDPDITTPSTPVLWMDASGRIYLGGAVVTGGVAAGEVSLSNAKWLRATNAAASTSLELIQLDSSNIVCLGITRVAATTPASFSATHIAHMRDKSGQEVYVPCMTASW